MFYHIKKDKVSLYMLIGKDSQTNWLSEEKEVCTDMCIENSWKDSGGYL